MPKGFRDDKKQFNCSFCGKSQDQVRKLVAGNGVFICNECTNPFIRAFVATFCLHFKNKKMEPQLIINYFFEILIISKFAYQF